MQHIRQLSATNPSRQVSLQTSFRRLGLYELLTGKQPLKAQSKSVIELLSAKPSGFSLTFLLV